MSCCRLSAQLSETPVGDSTEQFTADRCVCVSQDTAVEGVVTVLHIVHTDGILVEESKMSVII